MTGEYLLKHVKDITSGKTTLLTLPRCLIKRLIKYITVQDIVKLSSLSHVSKEIFDNNFVWETLYKRYCTPLTKKKYEKLPTNTYNWKKLFRLAEFQELSSEQKMIRTRASTKQTKPISKLENSTRTNLKLDNLTKSNSKFENPMKVPSSNSKMMSKIVPSENQMMKRSAEMPRKRNTQNSIQRRLSDNRLNEFTFEKDKVNTEKKAPTVKSLQVTGQKNIKVLREQSAVTKVNSKQETNINELINSKSAEVKANKIQNKVKRIDPKSSNLNVKTTEDKQNTVKSKSFTTQRNNVRDNKNTNSNRIEKSVSRLSQGDQVKPKSKGKSKKIGQSKSTILSTNTALLNDYSAINDDNFDLADLIEASLKNIRSPRSIFDCGFNCIEKSKSCGGDTKALDIMRKMADHPRALKSGHARATLDRLSEKSEPLTGKSKDSVGKNELLHASTTPNDLKELNTELKRSAELSKTHYKVTLSEEKIDHFERYGIYNKFPTPRVQENTEQKKPISRKEALDKMSLLRSLGSKALQGKGVSSTAAAEINRYEFGKTMNNVYKYL